MVKAFRRFENLSLCHEDRKTGVISQQNCIWLVEYRGKGNPGNLWPILALFSTHLAVLSVFSSLPSAFHTFLFPSCLTLIGLCGWLLMTTVQTVNGKCKFTRKHFGVVLITETPVEHTWKKGSMDTLSCIMATESCACGDSEACHLTTTPTGARGAKKYAAGLLGLWQNEGKSLSRSGQRGPAGSPSHSND